MVALIWGVNFPIVKFGTSLVDPLAYNGIRVALAAVLLTVIVTIGRAPFPARRTIGALLALGVLGNGVYQLLFVEGIARTRASDAALFVAASPAFIALIGRMRGVERISARAAVGIGLSIIGIALVVLGTATGAAGHASVLGDALVLAGSLSWALYTVLLKPYTHDVDGIKLSALTMVGGALSLDVYAWREVMHAHWSTAPGSVFVAMLFSGIGALVIAYLFWYRGVRVIGPTRTAMYSNLQPIFAVLVAWAALGEIPTVWQGVGAASIMSGLVLARS